MKKILLTLFVFLVAASIQLFAQEKVVTGKVTSYMDGSPIPGVSVVIKGTTKGTITDVNGAFKLSVPEDATIVFSFIGMTKEEFDVKDKTTFDVAMTEDIAKLSEVVVTAFGISREKKSLGYSVQDLKGEDLMQTRDNNMINSLSGKVAGVNVIGSSGTMGGSSRITLRGINSISGNNQPLFIIDGVPIDNSNYNTTDVNRGAGGYDYGNMASDINPDDIASVSVLKGPNAAALYGSRASNGVIIITTKKGTMIKGKGIQTIGVKVNSGVNFEKVSLLPTYQNLYGGGMILGGTNGFDQITVPGGDGTEYNIIAYDTDESFGPKYDPNIQYVPAWSIFDWEAAGSDPNTKLQTVPWTASENDVETFFKTGATYTNNFELFGGTETSAYRMSYTNVNYDGYMPNSKMKRNTVNVSGNSKLGSKVNTFGVITFTNTDATGRPSTGYDDNNVMQKFNQWGQRQLDMKKLENYYNPDGTQRVWNRVSWDDPTPNYSDNPYWTRNRNFQNDRKDNYFGNVGISWDIFDWLKATGKINSQYYQLRAEERVAIGSQAEPYYRETVRDYWEWDKELLFVVDKNLSDVFHLGATLGGNRMDQTYHLNDVVTGGGLQVADFYNLRNSSSNVSVDFDRTTHKKVNSVFGSASLGYNSLVYLDLTMRNDWSSTLPADNNSYLYPSVQLSFVFTELSALKDNKILTFGKVRAGWAKVGGDTDPYNLNTAYTAMDVFGSDFRYSLPVNLNNPELKPESTSSIETGAELKFFSNRAGIDFSYYSSSTTDQIIAIPVSGASGYTAKYVNAGEITNKGIELMINIVPIKSNNFKWDINYNFARNRNEVISLAPGIDVYQLGTAPFKVTINAKVGEPYGSIMGTDFVYDDNGNKLIGTDGRYLVSEVKVIGNIMPKYNMGINNNFRYKGIDFGFLIDYQKGGQLFSTTNMWGMYSGILEESAATNDKGVNIREDIANGGGVKNEGVYGTYVNGVWAYTDADGNPSSTPVSNGTYIDGQQYCHDFYDGPISQNVFKSDYIKLRELRVGYTLPAKITDKIKVKNLKISAFGRNLAIWGNDCPHIDPENTTSSGNIQGIEGGALPSLRTFGFNLSFEF